MRRTLTKVNKTANPQYVSRHPRAFSLIELLLVLVILAILAGVVLPKFTGRSEEARVTAAKTEIFTLAGALDMFEIDHGRYPTTQEGLLALVGVGRNDTPAAAVELARRLVHLRVFADPQGQMNRSLLDIAGTLGVVSQFTLYGDTRHGRRPSFGDACPAEQAAPLISAVVDAARELGASVVTGRFQASMELSLV